MVSLAAMTGLGLCAGCGGSNSESAHDAAAGPDASKNVDSGSGGDADADTGADTGADIGTNVDTGTDADTLAPSVGWTVDETTVGLAPLGLVCNKLPVYTGPSEIPAGSLISGKRFTGNVSLHQGNITIEKSCFQPTSAGQGMPIASTTNYNVPPYPSAKGKVIIRDSEFDGTLLTDEIAAYATGFIGIADLQRNYVHHFGSGLALMNTGTQLDALVEHNYVTDMLGWGNPATTGNHSDSFTIRDFTDAARPNRVAIIRNNRFDCDSPNATGAFFIQAWAGRIDNVTIQGNLLEGAGYNLVLESNNHGYSNVSATDNRFTPTGWGAAYHDGGEGWTVWQDNYRYDPTKPDGKGVPVSG
jgi:hypothetical protein